MCHVKKLDLKIIEILHEPKPRYDLFETIDVG